MPLCAKQLKISFYSLRNFHPSRDICILRDKQNTLYKVHVTLQPNQYRRYRAPLCFLVLHYKLQNHFDSLFFEALCVLNLLKQGRKRKDYKICFLNASDWNEGNETQNEISTNISLNRANHGTIAFNDLS